MTAPRNSQIDGASPVAVEDASPPPSSVTGDASTHSRKAPGRVRKQGESTLIGYLVRTITGRRCPYCEIAKPCNFCESMEAQL